MKDNIRNIFPGGNTSLGFYSYYNFILPQNKAEKIICLKGGPGVGKSTLMKKIGAYYEKKNEAIDLLWCSSDPDSLDGILLKQRNIAIIDGTSPHIIDPITPAVIDEIIDLGRFWNSQEIKKHKNQIMELDERIGKHFKAAYGYLMVVGKQYEFLWNTIIGATGERELAAIKWQLTAVINHMTPIRRAENKVKREVILGNDLSPGEEKKFFAGAITPMGVKNTLLSLLASVNKVIVLKTPIGFKSQLLVEPLANRFLDVGYDVEKYYCPIDPQNKVEHLIIPEIKTAVITCNSYHSINLSDDEKNIKKIEFNLLEGKNIQWEITRQLMESINEGINLGIKHLALAKECHDELESYYSKNMNYDEMEQIYEETIEKIDKIIL